MKGNEPDLTEDERKEIADATRNHDPEKRVIDFDDHKAIALLNLLSLR